jgi:hypothetical protein
MDSRYFRKRSRARETAVTRRRTTAPLPRIGLAALAVAMGSALGACGSTTTTTTPTPSSRSAGHSGTFNVAVNFTGAQNVQGSFTTPTVGATCAQYATKALEWTIGLGPAVGNPIPVDGVSINFLISVPQSTFHGQGTYSGNVVSGVTVGLDTFAGTDSTMTINGDGSGNASFTNYIGTTSSADESGTATWTCSG